MHHGDLGVGGQLLILVGAKDGLVQHTGDEIACVGHVGGLNLEQIPAGLILRIANVQAGGNVDHGDPLLLEVGKAGLHDVAEQAH